MVNAVWRRSIRDYRVHAFRPEQVAEPRRGDLEAICAHSASPGALAPVSTDRPGVDACHGCLLILGDRLADAGGHHSTPPP